MSSSSDRHAPFVTGTPLPSAEVPGIFFIISPHLSDSAAENARFEYVFGWPNRVVEGIRNDCFLSQSSGNLSSPSILFWEICERMLCVRALLEQSCGRGVLDFHAAEFLSTRKPLIIIGPVDQFNSAAVSSAMGRVPGSWLHIHARVT